MVLSSINLSFKMYATGASIITFAQFIVFRY